MAVHHTSNLGHLKAKMKLDNQYRLRRIVEDVHRNSNAITPRKKGGLRAAVLKQVLGNEASIEWREPYAQVQEQGGRTNPRTGKFIPFVNYTTPGTGKQYAEKSVEKAVNNAYIYFGDWL